MKSPRTEKQCGQLQWILTTFFQCCHYLGSRTSDHRQIKQRWFKIGRQQGASRWNRYVQIYAQTLCLKQLFHKCGIWGVTNSARRITEWKRPQDLDLYAREGLLRFLRRESEEKGASQGCNLIGFIERRAPLNFAEVPFTVHFNFPFLLTFITKATREARRSSEQSEILRGGVGRQPHSHTAKHSQPASQSQLAKHSQPGTASEAKDSLPATHPAEDEPNAGKHSQSASQPNIPTRKQARLLLLLLAFVFLPLKLCCISGWVSGLGGNSRFNVQQGF